MKRSSVFFFCAATILLYPMTSRGQDILSFETGGLEACSKATHLPIPGSASAEAEQKTFGSECVERDLAIEKRRFDALGKSIEERSPEERVAYNALIVSFTGFIDAYLSSEGCKGNTYCGVINKNDRAVLSRDFLVMAEGFGKDGFPSFTEDDLTREDAALNAAYQTKFSSLSSGCPDLASDPNAACTPQADLRDTERAWIRYRDMWVTFGRLRWPQVSSASWLTYLTQQRTRQMPGPPAKPFLHKV